MAVRVFGIRHHGPGCARALRGALREFDPDVVLVEGPPDADALLPGAPLSAMRPPVALLVYAADDALSSSIYPFAVYSPEWQALLHAAERGRPARFIDLPCQHTLALRRETAERAAVAAAGPDAPADTAGPGSDGVSSQPEPPAEDEAETPPWVDDPLGHLAEIAGFTDREAWWDVQVEQREDATGLFDAILEAMTALRQDVPEPCEHELRREAHMRQSIRAALKEGHDRIAVVCGAWHAPALATLGPAAPDQRLLRGLPKLRVAATWIPWTYGRLTFRSGYGAGVDAPRWYEQLWNHGRRAAVTWSTEAARLLREQDLDASVANTIETVRLADGLAALRGLPAPGLAELREAVEATLCCGEGARLALVRRELEVGTALGSVPDGVSRIPLLDDFEAQVKRRRLRLTPEQVTLQLDLRKDNDRERSRLLHQVRVLGVAWARPAAAGRGAGTFKEAWQLAWEPEFAVVLIAANVHGHTVEAAATRVLVDRTRDADLPALAELLETTFLCDLPAVLGPLLTAFDTCAAGTHDVGAQMRALPALVRLLRYGDVRGTRAEDVRPVVLSLFERAMVGIVPACSGLDDAAAADALSALDAAHAACLLLDDASVRADWTDALSRLLAASGVHPRIAGRVCRLLHAQGDLSTEALARAAGLALGGASAPPEAARWIEGLVAGEGLQLVHQTALIGVLDAWLAGLADDTFQAQLPILRRAFSALAAPERRTLAGRVRREGVARAAPAAPAATAASDLDAERVAVVLPVLAHILGVDHA